MALSVCGGEVKSSGRENIEHGTQAFPIACYGDDLQAAEVPWHWHDELEAAVVVQGSVLLSADSEKDTLHQGEGFFINAGVLHAAKGAPGTVCRLHSVVFHPRLLCSGVDGIYWQKYLQPLVANDALKWMRLTPATPWQGEALQAVEQAWQAVAAERPGFEFAVRDRLSALVFALLRHGGETARPGTSARSNERIKAMLQFIGTHYAEPLTVTQIAQSAAVSETECLRCFRATIGTPPIQYLKSLRLQKAAELLRGSNLKIADIGAQCGFQDMSYFARAFLHYKGCHPSAYRQQATP